jgi:hypothetical protein
MQRTLTHTLRVAIGVSFFAFILIGMNDGTVTCSPRLKPGASQATLAPTGHVSA